MATTPYTYGEINLLRPAFLETAEALRAAHPAIFAQAHNRQEPSGSEFCNLLVHALRAKGIRCSLNGKRGGRDLSQDVINFPVDRGGVPDAAGVVPGLVIIDFILAAGTPGQSIGWIDQTGPTLAGAPGLGRWIEPRPASVPLPPPGVTPPPVVVPPPAPVAPVCRVDGLGLAAHMLQAVAAAHTAAENADKAREAVDGVYQLIAQTLIAEHVGGIVERLGRLEQMVEADARASSCALDRFR